MLGNFDGQQLLPPSAAEIAERQAAERRNRAAFEAAQKAKEKAAMEAFKAQQATLAAEFKANIRIKYSALSDSDFERLWDSKLRDEALLAYAQQAHADRIAEYQALMI